MDDWTWARRAVAQLLAKLKRQIAAAARKR